MNARPSARNDKAWLPVAEVFHRGRSSGSPPASLSFITAASFVRAYEPLAYVVEPILRTQSIYTATAKTGAGKTALSVIVALAVATGRRDILGLDVECSRVAYLAFENADDVRMRIAVAAYLLGVDLDDLGSMFVILDVRARPEELHAKLLELSSMGEFGLIVLDTFAAGFDGADVNDNVASGEFVRRLRPLTQLPGKPALLIPAHPTKNASDDALVPYGGGAILNEVDGNLCLVKRADTGNAVLHWQGKFRGLEFQPISFRFELVSSPDIIDKKGRQVTLPVLRPVAPEDVEDRVHHEADVDRAILRCLTDDPTPSLREIGERIGRSKSVVGAKLAKLGREKLAEKVLDKWRLTRKGRVEISDD